MQATEAKVIPMAGHNKNHYRIIAIEEYARTLSSGDRFHIKDCCEFLNKRKAKGTNRVHKQSQTHTQQLAMLLKRIGWFSSLGNGIWVYEGGVK